MEANRKINIHAAAIYQVIKAQAGSLQKAMAEAVMNSIDAFASVVSVKITPSGFVIEDNGQGFRSVEEIATWFESIGFPHDSENHRMYGKFGMGRAQMWAYASTVWYSNQFKMDVDIKNKGIDYTLSSVSEKDAFKGTKIVGKFYNPMSNSDVDSCVANLSSLLLYAPGLINVNGHPVNKNPELESWTMETKEAWIRYDSSMPGMLIYNAGVLVRNCWKGEYHPEFKGVVISKADYPLSLNIARTDILTNECLVWKEIKKSLNKIDYNLPVKQTKQKLSGYAKDVLADSLKKEQATLSDALDNLGFLQLCSGRSVTSRYLRDLAYTESPVVCVSDDKVAAKKLSSVNSIPVISLLSLAEINQTPESFFDLVKLELKRYSEDTSAGSYSRDRFKEALTKIKLVTDIVAEYPATFSVTNIIKPISLKKSNPAGYCAASAIGVFRYKISSVIRRAVDVRCGLAPLTTYHMPEVKIGELPIDVNVVAIDSVSRQGGLDLVVKSEYLTKQIQLGVSGVARVLVEMAIVYSKQLAISQEVEVSEESDKEIAHYLLFTEDVSLGTQSLMDLAVSIVALFYKKCKEHNVKVRKPVMVTIDSLVDPDDMSELIELDLPDSELDSEEEAPIKVAS